jgi:hypothetical protein
MVVLILFIIAGVLVGLWLTDRASRRSSDERAVADSRANLERLGGIVTSVRRDELGRPRDVVGGHHDDGPAAGGGRGAGDG